jgi:hypothetical protein
MFEVNVSEREEEVTESLEEERGGPPVQSLAAAIIAGNDSLLGSLEEARLAGLLRSQDCVHPGPRGMFRDRLARDG